MSEKIPNIDFHSHIIPRADHGCKSSSECRAQLAMMREVGTDIAVATPHFYPHLHNVSEFSENVNAALARLKQVGAEKAPLLCIGAEVLLCENIDQLEGLSELCVRGTKTLLLELPSDDMNPGHYKTVEAILNSGYVVVLAHIDRYLKAHPEYVYPLLDMGALAQINPFALSTFGPKKHINQILADSESIVAIGSDLHGSKKGSLKDFSRLKKRLGEHYGNILARSNDLLSGAEMIDLTK
ncbi:MAG: hypothetical protein E7653_04025 [Ruminococcaceae bacterium]|nr:hypothetical protein [Oscillospiraceae bacterium]